MALFGHKKLDDTPVLFERDKQTISQLTATAYYWLGARYAWYNKIRNADKGGLASLFQGQNLEEQMQATRSALTLVTKTLNSGLVLAFNGTVDAVSNAKAAPEGWPEKIDMPDRNNPPSPGDFEDALIVSYAPIKFLNLAKMVRDKGKGIDYYAEGLIKKLTFKVLGYYSDPANWHADRLGYMFTDLTAESELQEINSRLSALKSDLEIFVSALQMFRFGGVHRNRAESGVGNTLEDTYNVTDGELISDLYFQSLLVNGMVSFIFRYYITMLSLAPNPRGVKAIAHLFAPALEKAMELRMVFQGSFNMERDKIRLRQPYQEFYKRVESAPPVEMQKIKGKDVRKINYSHRLFEMTGYAYTPLGIERNPKPWLALYQRDVLQQMEHPRTYPLLLELFSGVLKMMGFAAEGKHKVSSALRTLADEEEKLGQRQLSAKKKSYDIKIADKKKSSRKFKVLEQMEMAETVAKEAEQLEAAAKADLAKLEDAVTKRRAAKVKVAEHLDVTAREEKESGMGRSSASLYKLLSMVDTEHRAHAGLLGYLLQQIKEDNDPAYRVLYLNIFSIMPDLTPMEKIVLRKAVEGPLGLEENDLKLSEEDLQVYAQELHNLQAQLEQELPGIMDAKLTQGQVQATLKDLLKLGITGASLQVLLQLPLATPRKAAAKLPANLVKQVLLLNQLQHPFADVDLLLPNVEPTAAPAKRLNLSRLAKLVS